MSDYSEFVESHLTSIRCCEKEKRVEFAFTLADGAERRLAASGVDRMLVQEMREQNIAESIEVYDGTSSEDDIRWAVQMLTTPSGEMNPASYEPVIRTVMNRIAIGEQVLLAITPVYGAMVLVLATQISDPS